MECLVCKSVFTDKFGDLELCNFHLGEYLLWRVRWRAATGYQGIIDIKTESIVNMLRNNDMLRKVKSETLAST